MKNVTISMDETVAAWARIEAAKAGKSLSRFVGDVLAAQIEQKSSQSDVLNRILAYPKLDLTDEEIDRKLKDKLAKFMGVQDADVIEDIEEVSTHTQETDEPERSDTESN